MREEGYLIRQLRWHLLFGVPSGEAVAQATEGAAARRNMLAR
ncbi:hypothetical protein [Mitsuokella sp.]|nr:hypothetical protein [Mitsuokella sp.]